MITHVTRRYSRGNDDSSENEYETAQIEATLTVNTNDCNAANRCSGVVVPGLMWRAVTSTAEATFRAATVLRLRDTGSGADSVGLTFTPAPTIGPAAPGVTPPDSPRGSTLTAIIQLAVMSCRGSTQTGTAVIEQPGPAGALRTYERIDYSIEITNCGVIKTQTISVTELPSGAPGSVPVRLIDITPPPAGSPPGATGYPSFPGTPRTP